MIIQLLSAEISLVIKNYINRVHYENDCPPLRDFTSKQFSNGLIYFSPHLINSTILIYPSIHCLSRIQIVILHFTTETLVTLLKFESVIQFKAINPPAEATWIIRPKWVNAPALRDEWLNNRARVNEGFSALKHNTVPLDKRSETHRRLEK